MGVSIIARNGHDMPERHYAADKFARLSTRFAGVHDVRVTIGEAGHRAPKASAEAVVHLKHEHFATHAEGNTVREAVDLLLEKVDRQLSRRKERIKEHRGAVEET